MREHAHIHTYTHLEINADLYRVRLFFLVTEFRLQHSLKGVLSATQVKLQVKDFEKCTYTNAKKQKASKPETSHTISLSTEEHGKVASEGTITPK